MAAVVETPINTAQTSFTVFPGAKQQGEHYVPLPDKQEDGWLHAHARQTILVEPQALYKLWSDVTHFPLWQEHVVSVTPTSEKQTHWVMGNPEDPDGKRLEFDSEITEDIPGAKLAWKSIGGDVEQAGAVEFHSKTRWPRNRRDACTALQNRCACKRRCLHVEAWAATDCR